VKNILIVGASGFGRELLQWIKDINANERNWNIMGFLDDNLNALDGYECDYRVIGRIVDWTPSSDEVFALAIANPQVKVKIVETLTEKGAEFATVIHSTARVLPFARYGKGLVMYPGSCIGPNCIVGDYVTLLSSVLGNDVVVEDYSTISSLCGILGHVHIGKRVFIAGNAVIVPSKIVGNDVYVGAGSVVIRNVPAGKKVFGNPAKIFDV